MLTASTRLALVRQLGSEHFAETFFATTAAELTADGWRRHEQHVEGAAPLTEEERNLEGIKAAEALESGGTGARRVQTSGHLSMEVGDGVVEALKGLAEGSEANLVQLVSFFFGSVPPFVDGMADGGERGNRISMSRRRRSTLLRPRRRRRRSWAA